jgi:conjugal transfer pilus assembly protein TraD
MLIRKYEMPWRAASEAYTGTVWLAAMAAFFYLDSQGVAPWPVLGSLSVLCLVAALLRWYQAIRILVVRASLSGHAMQIITTDRLRQYCEQADDRVFLGFGFAWQPVHSQRLYELAKINYRDVLVSPWILRLLGYQSDPQPDAEIGMPYIHGVEPKEGPQYRPLLNFEDGTCIAGTTQSGKGVALSVLVSQAVYRGDVVIIFDPKNSKRLKGAVMKACADTRVPDTFLDFHPAFPEKVVRGGHVLYFALDSLPDPGVASAIAAIFLADLAAFAGMRYNLNLNRTRIALFVDEVANVINQPLIETLNKGAESGIYTTCAMQTLADLAKRLGSEEAARMALGNLNNLIALRSKDRPTQDFIVETFGKTAIHTLKVGLNTAADAHLGDFTCVTG